MNFTEKEITIIRNALDNCVVNIKDAIERDSYYEPLHNREITPSNYQLKIEELETIIEKLCVKSEESEATQLYVFVEKGMVRKVVSNNADVFVCIIDKDTTEEVPAEMLSRNDLIARQFLEKLENDHVSGFTEIETI